MTRGFIAISAVLLALPAHGAAQEGGGPQTKEQLQQRFQEYKERLALTPEQTGQVRPVLPEELRH